MFMSLISVHYNSSSSWLQLFYEQLKMRQNLKLELHGFLGILW
jgi:hypothetical protein